LPLPHASVHDRSRRCRPDRRRLWVTHCIVRSAHPAVHSRCRGPRRRHRPDGDRQRASALPRQMPHATSPRGGSRFAKL